MVSDSANVTSSGRSFRVCGPATGKAGLPAVYSLLVGTTRRLVPTECKTAFCVVWVGRRHAWKGRGTPAQVHGRLYMSVAWLIEQCLTSPPTQHMLYGRLFYRSKDPTNSIKVLKESFYFKTAILNSILSDLLHLLFVLHCVYSSRVFVDNKHCVWWTIRCVLET